MTNAAKHARADTIAARISLDERVLTVCVRDDGRGGATSEGTGTGLAGLRGRVEALDGRLRVTSPLGGPTVVIAELPCA